MTGLVNNVAIQVAIQVAIKSRLRLKHLEVFRNVCALADRAARRRRTT
jgi:hypothetical protein